MRELGPVRVLTNAENTGASPVLDTNGRSKLTMIVVATNVSSGATVALEGSPDGTNWYTIGSINVTASGTSYLSKNEAHPMIRANITSRTDGKYTVYLYAGRG
ncbi:MAG: hypothetical protein DRP11_03890 [Candidatus Aenigmatarchaeota archaeon]|nr:MAG: hypothetical protein DRP11_03890 [Candidatus Aenigmarchaeota archaeon]